MPIVFTTTQIRDLQKAISAPRFATYLREKNGNQIDAMNLYQWNLETSSAFFIPLQIFEVAIRNAVAEAIASVHGENWPWSNGFRRSVLSPNSGYNPQNDLIRTSNRERTTGKVIAELKFAFWQSIFTSGQDSRIWDQHFFSVFPNSPKVMSVAGAREYSFNVMADIRNLRNRIAHHEPIYGRPLLVEYEMLINLVSWRCAFAKDWLIESENVLPFLNAMP